MTSLDSILLQVKTSRSGWALTSEALLWIAHLIRAQHIQSVVECGSGFSTLMLASLQLKQVLSLEHNFKCYNETRQNLINLGLLDRVNLGYFPLTQLAVNDYSTQWYDISSITPFAADLILVDGPPGDGSPLARYPALTALKPFIEPGTWVLLDDCYRSQETQIAKLWLQEQPNLKLIQVCPFKFGLAAFQYI